MFVEYRQQRSHVDIQHFVDLHHYQIVRGEDFHG